MMPSLISLARTVSESHPKLQGRQSDFSGIHWYLSKIRVVMEKGQMSIR